MVAAEDRPSDRERGVYAISVAAELLGTGVQNLRAYETKGLVNPQRTGGGTRRYSEADLSRLRRITELLDAGLNLAGVAMVLDLQDANAGLRDRLDAAGLDGSAGVAPADIRDAD